MIEALAGLTERIRQNYAASVAGVSSAPVWWTAVVVTASSARQAERYRHEIERRRSAGTIPEKSRYLVVPDVMERRIGSGGATLNALREVARTVIESGPQTAIEGGLAGWFARQRILLLHCGGDSRRLPQYSLSGKLFSTVPVVTPWGRASTVFDEMLALSTDWAERIESGLVVGSGDVILTFDADSVDWRRPGITGVAILQPAEVGTSHGVYVADNRGRVYSFLQKPSISEIIAAGGMHERGLTAVDSGLLRFDPPTAARLMELAGVHEHGGKLLLETAPLEAAMRQDGRAMEIDLYQHFTMALTGEWTPDPDGPALLNRLASALRNVPFWCSAVPGDFTHIGTTSLFRRLMTEDTEFSRLHLAQRRLGTNRQDGVHSAGVVTDSVLERGAELKPGTIVIECHVDGPVRAANGAVVHGLEGIRGPLDVPEDSVVHQLPILLSDGRKGTVIRAYGVSDDPKANCDKATWFGRPLMESLEALGLSPDQVWPSMDPAERTLWNAELFPLTSPENAWACAQWMMAGTQNFTPAEWNRLERLSLATSAEWADAAELEAARSRRMKALWRMSAISLVQAGADVRPLLANAPGIGPLVETGTMLCTSAANLETSSPTDAAAIYYTAGLFQAQAGLTRESSESREAAFRMVRRAVESGASLRQGVAESPWKHDEVTVQGPARIDLGGGWSDSPPFCLDWGGTVLNIAVEIDGCLPIQATIRRLREPIVRCVSGADGAALELRTCAEILQPAGPGDETSIAKTALSMTALFQPEEPLARVLDRLGGGIEIRTEVNLPVGSGLGTSSILAACVLKALAEMTGETIDHQTLSDRVMQLEQRIGAGGGWQDQAGGIFRGAKVLISGPGLRQRIRVQPLKWTSQSQADFEERLVLYYTGIRRIARGLLQQVVGRYLGRETACVQVLHSIKTLALEMSHAMQEGDWEHLGGLLDRHWKLNQVLDPHTTNAPINSLLEAVRPYVYGAKLAGAGGGGYLMLLSRDAEAAKDLRRFLREKPIETGGAVCDFAISNQGMRLNVI